ncbi:unnamed protein product [Penicillium egyptiacum]|uniref:Xylanolytic transcriptional activator regulatory domain-containing protein n=1 Tax=Penicillium egyptiacum TaxID=1303716 RepID=A0A9W4P8I0_9EURO|nr:unnamed protein product [Penicillium egyptiacum]
MILFLTHSNTECLVEDPATGLHRPRDYMQRLEAKVEYLEDLLQKYQHDLPCDRQVSPSTESREASAEERSSPAVESTSNLDMLSSEVALLCLSAAGREPQFFGPSSAVFFSRIASASIDLPLHRSSWSTRPQVRDDIEYPGQSSMTSVELPSPAKAAMLTQAYFKSIHPQYPFLHRPTFLNMEQECLNASGLGDITTADPVSLFFVLMTYAIGSLALGQPEAEAAQISGMAIRQCVELGYHRSTEKYRPRADALTKEISKRCFWVAYDLDCVASFILGRPKGIPDNAIDVELPADIDDENITADGFLRPPRSSPTEPRTCMTGVIHVIKLRQLWSKISDNLYPNIFNSLGRDFLHQTALVKALRQELEEWRAGVPDELRTSTASPLSVFDSPNWFHIAYDYSILLLYRAQITSPSAILKDFRDSGSADAAFQVCADSARDICQQYRRLYQVRGRRIQFTWGSLHILFLAGLTFIYCLWRSRHLRRSTPQSSVINTCMACNTLLVIIAERWSQASSYRDIFESLSERTINMMSADRHATRLDDSDGSLPAQVADLPELFAPDAGLNPAGFGWMAGDQRDASPMNLDACGPFQEWIADLDSIPPPGDPHWLTQELLNEMGDLPNNFATNFEQT